MSEVIEDYIRRHPQLGQQETFDRFVAEERIQQWLAVDPMRRERLQREFVRVWAGMHRNTPLQTPAPPTNQRSPQKRAPPASPAAPKAPPRPAPAQPTEQTGPAPRAGPAGPTAAATPGHVRRAPADGARLHLLCDQCGRYAIFARGSKVICADCGREHEDMLRLVPVRPVGPFEFVFGEGWKGIATASGLGLLLIALYGVLRWA